MSRKSYSYTKGKKLQDWVRDQLFKLFPHLEEDDVRSAFRGEHGEDLKLSPLARRSFPFSIECKNVEKLSFWASWKQCEANSGKHTPIMVLKKNNKKPVVVLDAEFFLNEFFDK
jgi:hypothetical protein